MDSTSAPRSGSASPISDELFARAAVQKGLAELTGLRECLATVRKQPVSERRPLHDVMLREGVLGRRDVEVVEMAVRSGDVSEQRIGRYEILAMIGEGGMGAVYAAADVDTLEFCALKILPKELAEDDDIVRRFLQEAETACTLRHPNIVGGIRVGEDQGVHFFSMEFVDGETVYDRLETEGVLPEGESLRIVRGTCLGLQYASEKGLVHRDIKPENIMISRDGTPKLLDMGLVKRLDAGRGTRLTQTGMAIGTPHYISPEQARGEEKVDARSDIYALGATLYHMVTGQVPFEGNTAAVIMTKHLSEELDYPSDINPQVSEHTSRLISKMMAKARDERYARPKDVVADIDLILTGRAPSGDMLPPGASTIRQAVQIRRAKERAKRGVTTVHARIERRERSGLKDMLAKHRRPLIYAASVLVALNLVFFVLLMFVSGGPEPVPAAPAAATISPQAPQQSEFDELIERLGSTPVDDLPDVFNALPDPASLALEDAQRLADAVRGAAARFDAEADRRLGDALARVDADPGAREVVLEELRGMHSLFAESLAADRIEKAIARLAPPPPPQKRPPPEIRPVALVSANGMGDWHAYGKWSAEDGALVFTYDAARKYERAVQSLLGFGEFRLAAEIKTIGGTRAEVAVWDQSTADRKRGATASVAAAVARGADLSPAQGLYATLEVTADPERFSASLAGRKLPTHVEGRLRNGRLRFSLVGGKWWIRNLTLVPAVPEGDVAYSADFLDDGHGWTGEEIDKWFAATEWKDSGGGVWAEVDGRPDGGDLFETALGMRMSVVFRAENVSSILAALESTDGKRWDFRLSGRPPAAQWTALTVRLADFRSKTGAPPPPGVRIKKMLVGAEGRGAQLLLSSVRVVGRGPKAALRPGAGR